MMVTLTTKWPNYVSLPATACKPLSGQNFFVFRDPLIQHIKNKLYTHLVVNIVISLKHTVVSKFQFPHWLFAMCHVLWPLWKLSTQPAWPEAVYFFIWQPDDFIAIFCPSSKLYKTNPHWNARLRQFEFMINVTVDRSEWEWDEDMIIWTRFEFLKFYFTLKLNVL